MMNNVKKQDKKTLMRKTNTITEVVDKPAEEFNKREKKRKGKGIYISKGLIDNMK